MINRIVDLIVGIADIHVGHPAAPWPDNYHTPEGNHIKPNKAQQVLGDYWTDFWNKPEVREAKYIFNLEESIEGYSKKEHGRSMLVTDLNEQATAFKLLLEPHIKGKKYIGVEGSKYHGSEDVLMGQEVCKLFKGHYCGHIGNIQLKKSKKIIQILHKGMGAVLYKASALDRYSLYTSAIKTKVHVDPDLILMGHGHQYFGTMTPTRQVHQLPSWKFWHPIKDASRYPFTQPTIGGLVVKVMENGRIYCDVHSYPLVHVYDALVEM
jgi:hypothetical protein